MTLQPNKLVGANLPRKNSLLTFGYVILMQLLLTSCVFVQNRTELPVDPPESFSESGTSSIENKWWLEFQDDSLNLLVEKAFEENFSLLATRSRIMEAEALAKQAGAALLPTLDASGDATTQRNYQTDRTTDSFSLRLAASYEIDLWNRLRSTQNAALFEFEATLADYQTAALTLAAEVTLTWFEYVENNLQIKLLEKQQQTNIKVLQVITAQFKSGKTPIADVLQQRQLVEANSGAIATLKGTGRQLQNQLSLLLGQGPGTALPVNKSLPDLSDLPDTGIPLTILQQRPDVQARMQRLQAADFRVAAAVADKYPKLSISASVSTGGSKVEDLFSNWFSNLGINLFGPLFDGDRRTAEVDRTMARAQQLYYQYGQTIVEALTEVENNLSKENELQAVAKSLQTQLSLAAETIEHVANRYRQGAEDYQRVLLTLISHQNLQRDILRSKRQRLSNRVSLYRAISGPIDSLPQDNDPGNSETSPSETKIINRLFND